MTTKVAKLEQANHELKEDKKVNLDKLKDSRQESAELSTIKTKLEQRYKQNITEYEAALESKEKNLTKSIKEAEGFELELTESNRLKIFLQDENVTLKLENVALKKKWKRLKKFLN